MTDAGENTTKKLAADETLLVQECVRKQLRGYAAIFGITNLAALVAAAVYILFVLPTTATKAAVETSRTMMEFPQKFAETVANKHIERVMHMTGQLSQLEHKQRELVEMKGSIDEIGQLVSDVKEQINAADLERVATVLSELESNPTAGELLTAFKELRNDVLAFKATTQHLTWAGEFGGLVVDGGVTVRGSLDLQNADGGHLLISSKGDTAHIGYVLEDRTKKGKIIVSELETRQTE